MKNDYVGIWVMSIQLLIDRTWDHFSRIFFLFLLHFKVNFVIPKNYFYEYIAKARCYYIDRFHLSTTFDLALLQKYIQTSNRVI